MTWDDPAAHVDDDEARLLSNYGYGYEDLVREVYGKVLDPRHSTGAA